MATNQGDLRRRRQKLVALMESTTFDGERQACKELIAEIDKQFGPVAFVSISFNPLDMVWERTIRDVKDTFYPDYREKGWNMMGGGFVMLSKGKLWCPDCGGTGASEAGFGSACESCRGAGMVLVSSLWTVALGEACKHIQKARSGSRDTAIRLFHAGKITEIENELRNRFP